jgi:hypothetical protein
MKLTTKILTFLSALALLVLPAQSVLAKSPLDGQVIVGENYTLSSGDEMNGDLVIVGGNVIIEPGATVNGSVVLVGGNLAMNGTVNGDMVAVFGVTSLGDQAAVSGNMVTVFGTTNRDPKAEIGGDLVSTFPAPGISIPVPTAPEAPTPPTPPTAPSLDLGKFGKAFGILLRSAVIAGLAMLVVLFLPNNTQRVARAMVSQPLVTGGFGLLTTMLAPIVILVLAITIILSPIAVIAAAVLLLAWLFGVIAMGVEAGQRFTNMIGQTWAPVLSAGFGTFLLVLVVEGIALVPCIGWMVPFVLGLIAVGGVAVTIFGSRQYPTTIVKVAPVSEEQ